MIRIEERATVKLPGETSLFVSFDFNKTIVDELKILENTFYNPEEKEWEIPLTGLSEFIDRTCKIDDIDIKLLPESKQSSTTYDLMPYKTTPFDYQEEGIQFGLNHTTWLLLDAPGLGKTLQLTYLAQELKERYGIQHCLIVCGINTLKTNWKTEIEKHSDLSARILGQRVTRTGKLVIGGIPERLQQLKEPIDEFFVIVNVESLRDDRIVKGILKGPNSFDMIVFDEIHTCFAYDTLIHTDKGMLKIGDIVTKDIDCCVYSYNHKRQTYEYMPILAKHTHNTTKLLELTFEEDGITRTLTCTPDHKIFTKNRGYVPASDLTSEDDLLFDNIV